MAMTIHVDIVSAEGEVFSGMAEMVYAPAEMGEVGIAPRHAPLITRLQPGEVRVDEGNGKEMLDFYVSGGLLEVQPHMVTVLTDTAIRATDLDEAKALEAKQKAEDVLSGQTAEFEYAKAQIMLAEAAAQLRAIEKTRQARGN
jgi:F-type H+-transporting ATPase subunit epsilon